MTRARLPVLAAVLFLLAVAGIGWWLHHGEPVRILAPAPDMLAIASGDFQSGSAGETLPCPLVVTLRRADSSPIANAEIVFTLSDSSALILPENQPETKRRTAADGKAAVLVRLPSSPRTFTVTARIGKLAVQSVFTVTGRLLTETGFTRARALQDGDAEHLATLVKPQGRVLLFDRTPLRDNVDLRAEWQLKDSGSLGIVLYEEKNAPSRNDYALLAVAPGDTPGERKLAAWGVTNGRRFYYHAAGFQSDSGTLRLVYDRTAEALHLFVSERKFVDGQWCDGWFELPTMPLPNRPRVAGVFSSDTDPGRDFTRMTIEQTPIFDPPDFATGFRAVWRPYTFSGLTDTALVITFDTALTGLPNAKFVFWRNANFIPWWHVSNTCAQSYGFVELWGGGTTGCCEPMSDRLLRWSRVELVEANPARIVVRWRYVLANHLYEWWGKGRKKPEVEEEYTFLPDGTVLRRILYRPVSPTRNELSELITVNAAGSFPSEHLERTALSMLDLNGDAIDFTWDLNNKKTSPALDARARFRNELIFRINLAGGFRPYEVFAQTAHLRPFLFPSFPSELDTWEFGEKGFGWYEFQGDFNTFSHWPVSWQPYEDPSWSAGRYVREASHTSLLSINAGRFSATPATWVALLALLPEKNDTELLARVRAWLYPGQIAAETGAFLGVDYARRALRFRRLPGRSGVIFAVGPENKSPTLNRPFLSIRDWKESTAFVFIDKKPLAPHEFVTSESGVERLVFIRRPVPLPAEIAVCPTAVYPDTFQSLKLVPTPDTRDYEFVLAPICTAVKKPGPKGFLFLSLPYNQDMISDPKKPVGSGWDFPGDHFPAFTGVIVSPESKVPFKMLGAEPDNNCFELRGERIAVNVKGVKRIHFLGLSHSGGAPTTIRIVYQDGRIAEKQLALPEWWDPANAPHTAADELVLSLPTHMEGGRPVPPGAGLWRTAIETDSDAEIAFIEFPFYDKIRLFAITLAQ